MDFPAWALLGAFLFLLLLLAWPLAAWMHRVVDGRFAIGRRIEAPLYRLAGVRPDEEQGWRDYALGLLVFSVLGVVAVFGLQLVQDALPLNPAGMKAVSADSAFNTAVSFVTNTNWQGYAGEATTAAPASATSGSTSRASRCGCFCRWPSPSRLRSSAWA